MGVSYRPVIVRMAVVVMMVMVAPVRVAVMVSQGPCVKSDPSSQRVKEVRGMPMRQAM